MRCLSGIREKAEISASCAKRLSKATYLFHNLVSDFCKCAYSQDNVFFSTRFDCGTNTQKIG